MAEHAKQERRSRPAERVATDEQAGTTTATRARGEELTERIDELLEEIDGVLEQNAEEFVAGYVQRGGQ